MSTKMTKEQIIDLVKNSPHPKVKVAIADIDGVLRGKLMQKEKFLSAVEGGFGFCDVIFGWDCNDISYDNSKFTGWHSGYPDISVEIALETHRNIPWERDIPFFLGSGITEEGSPLPICPRQLLKGLVQKARDNGLEPNFGMEFEWFNFKETPDSVAEKGVNNLQFLTPGMFGYSILRSSLNSDYFHDLFDLMTQFGVPIEGLHTETGPGVYEVAIHYSDALEAADRGVLFKNGAKEIGYRHNILPTFMAKWSMDLPGCSGHLHQSLWSRGANPRNLFHDADSPDGLSDTMRHYIAGQLLLLPDLLPMFAPTINSYKRLCPGFWAPTIANWAIDNRTVALRALPVGPKATRLETRVSGSDVNPYLAISAALASGLYGVLNKVELTSAPIVGNGYEDTSSERLPGNLHDAAQRMAKSPLAREILGDSFVEHFTASRLWEWRQFQQSVTDWEKQRYFEII